MNIVICLQPGLYISYTKQPRHIFSSELSKIFLPISFSYNYLSILFCVCQISIFCVIIELHYNHL